MSTPEHWAFLREWGADSRNTATALLELCARVEALEAAANHPAKPDSSSAPAGSLVEQVADAIYRNGAGDGFREEARAAIRVVAAWLRTHGDPAASAWAMRLEQEVDR